VKTSADALKQAQLAKKVWLEAARAAGKPIPKPRYRPAIYQTGS
jgi:predicted RNase H-like HicB family nuclease